MNAETESIRILISLSNLLFGELIEPCQKSLKTQLGIRSEIIELKKKLDEGKDVKQALEEKGSALKIEKTNGDNKCGEFTTRVENMKNDQKLIDLTKDLPVEDRNKLLNSLSSDLLNLKDLYYKLIDAKGQGLEQEYEIKKKQSIVIQMKNELMRSKN